MRRYPFTWRVYVVALVALSFGVLTEELVERNQEIRVLRQTITTPKMTVDEEELQKIKEIWSRIPERNERGMK